MDDSFVVNDPQGAHILGIDPGSFTMGYGCMKIDALDPTKIRNAIAWTDTGPKLPGYIRYNTFLYDDKFARLQAHKKKLGEILEAYEPTHVACEAPFYNPARPNAYGVLVEVTTLIREVVYAWDPQIQVFFVAPSLVKKNFGAKGSKKEHMAEAFTVKTDLHFPGTEGIDEHAIDALAVAYSHYKKLIS